MRRVTGNKQLIARTHVELRSGKYFYRTSSIAGRPSSKEYRALSLEVKQTGFHVEDHWPGPCRGRKKRTRGIGKPGQSYEGRGRRYTLEAGLDYGLAWQTWDRHDRVSYQLGCPGEDGFPGGADGDEPPGYCGNWTTPSCCNMPACSQCPHASLIRPWSMRKIVMPGKLTYLPVALIPRNVPRCVPLRLQRTATLFPSEASRSMDTFRSGKADCQALMNCFSPSGPSFCPAIRLLFVKSGATISSITETLFPFHAS